MREKSVSGGRGKVKKKSWEEQKPFNLPAPKIHPLRIEYKTQAFSESRYVRIVFRPILAELDLYRLLCPSVH